MRIRSLDASGDWQFGRGLQSYVDGQLAILENVATRLRSWYGDCFFALEDGIDWQNRLGRMGQREALESEILTMILSTDGVLSVDDWSFEVDVGARRAVARYRINTIYSDSMSDVVEVSL